MGKIRQVEGYSGCWGGAAILNEMTRAAPRRGLRGGEGSGLWVSGSDHPKRRAAGTKALGYVWHARSGKVRSGVLARCIWRVERWERVA